MLNNSITVGYIQTVMNNPEIPIFRKNQEGKSPAKPYVTYNYIGNVALGAAPQIYNEETTDGMTEHIYNTRTPTLEIQFFTISEFNALTQAAKGEIDEQDYKTANDYAQEFEDSLKSSRVKSYMRENGFSVLESSIMLNLDVALGDMWERRALIELTMNDISEVSNDTEYFTPPMNVNITVEDI